MRTMMILRGLPASGKSTWAKAQVKASPDRWKRVNKDELRAMIDAGDYSPDREKFIDQVQAATLRAALEKGFDVIVDNTHFNGRAVKKLHELAKAFGDITVTTKTFKEDVETCIARDAKRPAPVGEDVIRGMWLKHCKRGYSSDSSEYYPKREFAAAEQDMSLPECIICDLDGTLSLLNGRDPYDATRSDNDLPNEPVQKVVRWAHAHGVKIIFMTGREDKFREPSALFLEQHAVYEAETRLGDKRTLTIPHELYMRRTGDMRPDNIVKREMYDRHVKDKYRVLFVLDDRPKVVRMWRHELGMTVFQLNDVEF